MPARKRPTRAKAGKATDEAQTPDPAEITRRGDAEAFVRAAGPFRCRGKISDEARATVTRHLERGELEQARAADTAGRTACGADLTDLFATGPLDGEEHPYECPQCGNTGTYRAARFPKLRATAGA